ncbi:HEPN domain-containing protein [Spirosoma soli]|uniref:HEPN domain-containing protein n=1 Tax=Spirosoma soli TaxID=1770529 RepID=A0ABW5MBP5_9BACT
MKTKEDTIAFRQQKSDRVWAEAMSMIRDEHWEGAANRMYYSAFHAVSALLLSEDIPVKSHSGAKAMLELHIIKSGRIEMKWSKLYTKLYENRTDSDYEDFAVFNADDILPLVPQTEEFIDVIKRLINS